MMKTVGSLLAEHERGARRRHRLVEPELEAEMRVAGPGRDRAFAHTETTLASAPC